MQWMIRNDGKFYEIRERISIDPALDFENLSAYVWYYSHTNCIVSGYYILRLLVLMARKENSYIAPTAFYGICRDRGYLTEMFFDEIKSPIDGLYDVMRSQDLRLDEEMHLPGEYEDEIVLTKQILKLQMDQEFVYVSESYCVESGLRKIEVYDNSVAFNWKPVLRSFLDKTGAGDIEIRIVKHGYDSSMNDIENVLTDSGNGSSNIYRLVIGYLSDGRAVYSLLSKAGYNWSRALQHIRWIRYRERHRIMSFTGIG